MIKEIASQAQQEVYLAKTSHITAQIPIIHSDYSIYKVTYPTHKSKRKQQKYMSRTINSTRINIENKLTLNRCRGGL